MAKKVAVPAPADAGSLFAEIREMIAQSRQQVAAVVNSAMTMLYWQVGRRIQEDLLQHQRAEYGKQVVASLSKELTKEYGSSFSEKNLRRMLQFAVLFPEKKIVASLIRQLSWTHILAIIPIEDPLKRDFYIEMCKLEKWSVRTLRERINAMLYERTAISKKPELTIQHELQQLRDGQQPLSPDFVFRDPYFLDFLGLADVYSERDLESAILVELQKFIIEMGSDFAFLARQKRIIIDDEDHRIDLLFYHRRLRCLVAIDLKLGKFEAAHKGQMELYLRWLEKYESVAGENPPVGLILCASKSKEQIELLRLEESNIKVAEYLTKLPELKLLEQKLKQAIAIARNKLGDADKV